MRPARHDGANRLMVGISFDANPSLYDYAGGFKALNSSTDRGCLLDVINLYCFSRNWTFPEINKTSAFIFAVELKGTFWHCNAVQA